MFKTTFIALAVVVALSGCSKPQETIIPTDMSQWDKELAPSVKKLSEEDRQAFTSFVMRAKMSEIFSKGNAIPLGMTIGDAITSQKKWEEEQKIKAAEELALKEKIHKEALEAHKKIASAATVALVKLDQRPKDYNARRYSDQQVFIVAIQNNSQKNMAGISGRVVFTDIFDKQIGDVSFSVAEKIMPGQTYTWTGVRDYNQFMREHRMLWEAEEGKYKTSFTPSEVIFEDGERIKAPKEL
ncbi:MAG: hypothetical protein RSE32_03245 [Comamonas sp.]|uniref:hypothetical protein n=1 Tax=Comamonas sp. TaxID=34028 RepID=UPI002FC7C840